MAINFPSSPALNEIYNDPDTGNFYTWNGEVWLGYSNISIKDLSQFTRWVDNAVGIHTLKNVGIGTTNPTNTLTVLGNVQASSFAVAGGTSNQFLKANGTVDSSTYLTSYTETDTLNSVTTRGNTTANGISVGILTATRMGVGILTATGISVGVLTATSLVRSGGTSSQFLKADGSVDSSTYLTTTGSAANLTGLTGASSGTYGSSSLIPRITIDANGRITGIGTTTVFGGGGVGITDGDKGDITVSGSGATWTIDNTAVTYAKIQNVTNGRILGRVSGSSGSIEEITIGTGLALSGGSLSAISGGTSSQWVTTSAGIHTLSNVGIGTTNPQANLQVAGSILVDQLRTRSIAEKTTLINGNTVGLAFSTGGGNVAICTNPTGNITLNVTNIPTDSSFDNHSMSFSVIVTQTGTARTCTSVTLNGVSRTIRWSGGSLANALSGVSTSSGYDIFTFTGINTVGSASTTTNYVILGSVNGGFN